MSGYTYYRCEDCGDDAVSQLPIAGEGVTMYCRECGDRMGFVRSCSGYDSPQEVFEKMQREFTESSEGGTK